MTYWVPVSDRETTAITNFNRWEQAFRVFSNLYTYYFPQKAGDLIQYNHVIFTTSQTYAWDNVYRYDREFRMHIGRHHPHRNWSTILQQAWSMYLKDKINHQGFQNGKKPNPRRRLCFDFNKGICEYGQRCKFDHRCSFCEKYGHGAYNCRKAKKNGGSGGNNGNGNGRQDRDKNRWERYKKDFPKQSASKSNGLDKQ